MLQQSGVMIREEQHTLHGFHVTVTGSHDTQSLPHPSCGEVPSRSGTRCTNGRFSHSRSRSTWGREEGKEGKEETSKKKKERERKKNVRNRGEEMTQKKSTRGEGGGRA